MDRQHNDSRGPLMSPGKWRFIAILLISMTLVGCASMSGPSEGWVSESGEHSLTRIRLNEVMAWQMLEPGQLQISLNSPQRTYRLVLQPSCTFALREAVDFKFSGKSSDYISLGDDVVVGGQRCRIVGIFLDDSEPLPRLGLDKR